MRLQVNKRGESIGSDSPFWVVIDMLEISGLLEPKKPAID
jgi:hypothetical protein